MRNRTENSLALRPQHHFGARPAGRCLIHRRLFVVFWFLVVETGVVDNATSTLLHLLLQKSVTESLGLEHELATSQLQDSAIICSEFGSTDGFVMSRVAPKAADSG